MQNAANQSTAGKLAFAQKAVPRLMNEAKSSIRRWGGGCLCLLLLWLPNAVDLLPKHRIVDLTGISGLYLLLSAICLSIRPNIKFWLVLASPVALLAFLQCGVIILLKCKPDRSLLAVLIENLSNAQGDFLSGLPPLFLVALLSYLGLYASGLMLTSHSPRMSVRLRLTLLFSGLALLAAAPRLRLGSGVDSNYWAHVYDEYANVFPLSLIHLGRMTHEYWVLSRRQIQPRSIKIVSSKREPPRMVFVLFIGETARYNSFSINGYKTHETNPLLKTRMPRLLSFSNAVAGSWMTHRAVPLMLTPEEAGGDQSWESYSVIHAFKAAGFRTYWIRNGLTAGLNTVDRYAKSADRIYTTGAFDSGIAQKIRELLSEDKSSRIFIVAHSIGSHSRYDERYPDAFNRFRPSGKDVQLNSYSIGQIDALRNDYDNTILYTDHVLSETISALESSGAASWLVYSSDHGENLCDDSSKQVLHAAPTEFSLHVPLLVWTSSQFDQAWPEKRPSLVAHLSSPISTSGNLFDTILDLGGLSSPDRPLSRSFASRAFQPLTERFAESPGRDYTVCYERLKKAAP